jgi:uncharacterized membrane protein YfcA
MSFHIDISPAQWALGGAAALIIGISKTGVPGVGILVVPVLAIAFGGRSSVGAMVPMLLVADCFAVRWYGRHTRWDRLRELLPWVFVGLGLGAIALWMLGARHGHGDSMGPLIGWLVLALLGVQLARMKWGDRIAPSSRAAVAAVGTAAGFSTTVSNAAGPIMGIYLTAIELPKSEFMGTAAWYFLLINLSKLPLYVALTLAIPSKPLLTASTLAFNVAVLPLIVLGVFLGRWMLPRIPQRQFDALILVLAAAAAAKLIVG